MNRKILHINKPSSELKKFVKNLGEEKDKVRKDLLANKHLYFSK